MFRKRFFILFLFLIFLTAFFSSFNFFKNETKYETRYSSPTLYPKNHQQSFSFTLLAVGDIMLGRSVNSKMRRLNNFTYPFEKTWDFLKSADLTFGNLESPFFSNCPTTDTGMTFCADPRAIEGLVKSGFDILNLANNHILNYGQAGLKQTQEILKKENILPLVQNEEQILEIKKTKIGFLGFNLTGTFNKEQVLKKIKEIDPKVDILIVSFHWGEEYSQEPSKDQIELAHQAIDFGADLILGHHPHVIQPSEKYKEKIIVYSLGNFIFDQEWSQETKKGLLGVFTFQNKKIIRAEFKEVYSQTLGQPEIEN